VQPGQPLYPLIMVSGGRYSAMGGGVPLSNEGEVVAGVGVSGDQLLQVARSLEQVSPQHWEDLTKPTDSVPCGLRARCK